MAGYTTGGYGCDVNFYDAFGLLRGYYPDGGTSNLPLTMLFAGQQGAETFSTGTDPTPNPNYGNEYNPANDTAGQILMGYRLYNPTSARFLTRDPAGYGGGINLYAYCRNNPVNHFDPMGLQGEGGQGVLGFVEAYGLMTGTFHQSVVTFGYSNGHITINRNMHPFELEPEVDLILGGAGVQISIEQLAFDFEQIAAKIKKKVPNPHGTLGKPSTRALDAAIAKTLTDRGWTVTGGPAGVQPQEWLRPSPGVQLGSARPDITAQKNIGGRLKTLRINTVTLNKNGTLNNKEVAGFNAIRKLAPSSRDQKFILIPKRQ